MPNRKKIKVAIIDPPIVGHKIRGTGEYTKQLYAALKKSDSIEIDLIKYKDRKDNSDLIHYPYFDPFFLTLPLYKEKPSIVTVHDLIPLRFPEFFPAGIKGTMKWWMQRLSLRGSTAIITDSFASKDDIVKFTGIEKGKISVIYLGVGREFKVIRPDDWEERLKAKLKIPTDFILHVGDVNYNKNILGMIRAFKIVTDFYPSLSLVFVGNGFITSSPQLDEILGLIYHLKISDKVYRLAHVTSEELVRLYNLAKIYLQPSFAEGFGLPVLEAMACGCPTIVSNTSSLPEIAGNAAIKINPRNIEEITNGIKKILDQESLQKELIQKGFNQAKLFSWEKCARETINIYESLLYKIH